MLIKKTSEVCGDLRGLVITSVVVPATVGDYAPFRSARSALSINSPTTPSDSHDACPELSKS